MNKHKYYNIKRLNKKLLVHIKIVPKGYGKMIALKKGGTNDELLFDVK